MPLLQLPESGWSWRGGASLFRLSKLTCMGKHRLAISRLCRRGLAVSCLHLWMTTEGNAAVLRRTNRAVGCSDDGGCPSWMPGMADGEAGCINVLIAVLFDFWF